MKTIFTLASARSGTLFLKSLFERNVRDCVCRHEPFFDWGNPTLFGRAIYDAYAGRLDGVRELLARKRDYIGRLRSKTYLESSHAFLKSAYVVAREFFPEMGLIHLVRDPLLVARSEAWREAWRRRVHAPFHFYKAEDGGRHFAWALTGNEEIFKSLGGGRLTLFQWYVAQWVEIENRAIRFLEEHQLHDRCFTLETKELNDPGCVKALFEFFGLPTRTPEVVLAGRKNRSLGYHAAITAEEETQAAEVLGRLPDRYLEIFQSEPYVDYSWGRRLVGKSVRPAFAEASARQGVRT